MDDFKIEIPMDFQGTGKGSGNSDKILKDLNDNVKKLDKTVYGTIDWMEMLSSLLGDVYKVIQPIFKLLSILLLVFFIPFIPVIKLLAQAIGDLIKGFSKFFKGDLNFSDFIQNYVIPALVGVIKAIGEFIATIFINMAKAFMGLAQKYVEVIVSAVVWIAEKFKEAITWVVDEIILPAFNWLSQMIYSVWTEYVQPAWVWLKDMIYSVWTNYLQPAWEYLKSVGEWIWARILEPAWNWFKDIGSKIWNILKGAFEGAVSMIKNAIRRLLPGGSSKSSSKTSVNDAIIQPNGHIIQTSPKDYLIATKDPSSLGGKGNVTINFNNPVVREENDLKKIAEATSKILERKLWRSY